MFKLTEKQQAIINSDARVKLVMGAMRTGKTIAAILNMHEEMKQNNNPDSDYLFLVHNNAFVNYIFCEMKRLGVVNNSQVVKTQLGLVFTTDLGRIHLSIDPCLLIGYENPYKLITVDNATSNKHIAEGLLEKVKDCKIVAVGHFPENIENVFFKIWLKEYFSKNSDTKAFLFNNTFVNMDEGKKNELIKAVGAGRFNRDYLGILDYTKQKHR